MPGFHVLPILSRGGGYDCCKYPIHISKHQGRIGKESQSHGTLRQKKKYAIFDAL